MSDKIPLDEIVTKISNVTILGASFASLPVKYQNIVIASIREQTEKELDKLQASTLGLSLDEYYTIKSLPAGFVVDWSKVGKNARR